MILNPEVLTKYNKTRKTKNKAIFCHAPFTSMNFEQNGNVTVCCYNRTYLMGTYPNDSLQEMWCGDKAVQFRKEMKNNVLPTGCDICHNQFQSKNFGGLRAQFYDVLAEETYPEENGHFIPMPKVMEFEISNVCNLECIMCNGYYSSLIRKNREHLPPLKSPYDDQFVKQLEPFIPHLTEAKFLGGEPFLINTFYSIWDLIIRLNPSMKVSITTNATVLNDRVKNVLEKLNVHIILSIDSLKPENYERIRTNARFDQAIENIQYFKDYVIRRNTTMTLAVCPMKGNWQEMPHFLKFCNKQDIRLFFNTVIFPEESSLMTMRKDELSELVEYLNTTQLTEDTEVEKYNNSNYLDLIQQVLGYRDKAFEYDEYISHDSLNEHRILLELFEGNYKLDEYDEVNKRINFTISEILKRFVNHKKMGKIKFDRESSEVFLEDRDDFFYTVYLKYKIFHANEIITKSLESISQRTEGRRFIREFFNIMKIVIQVLQDKDLIIPIALIFEKLEHACEIITSHSKNSLIMKSLIATDPVLVLERFNEIPLDRISQELDNKFNERALQSPSSPEARYIVPSNPIYAPDPEEKLSYSDELGSDFKQEDTRGSKWWLRVEEGNLASTTFPSNKPEMVRISIVKAQTKVPWDIQLNQPHLVVEANKRYVVSFQARADSARRIILGFSKAYEPWDGLGLYKDLELTPIWQSYKEEFVATADEEDARIHFDLGASSTSIEISDVILRSLADDQTNE